jgi:hypothetical protein
MDIIDPNEPVGQTGIEDDPEAVASLEKTRGQSQSDTMEDFGKCPSAHSLAKRSGL